MQKKLRLFLLEIAVLSVSILSLNPAFHSIVVASTSNPSLSTPPASQRVDGQSPNQDYDEGYLKGEWAGHQAGAIDCEAKSYNPQRKPRVPYPETEYYRGYAAGEHDGYEAGYKTCQK